MSVLHIVLAITYGLVGACELGRPRCTRLMHFVKPLLQCPTGAGEDRRPQSRHQRGSPEGSHRLTERHEERHLDQQGRLHTALAGRQLQQMPFPIPRMGGQQGMGMVSRLAPP